MSSVSKETTITITALKALPRLNWDEYFITQAFHIATRSPSKKLRVGAVITQNNRIISAGYNGFFSNSKSAKRGVSTRNTTIYITHYPCIHCTKFIIGAGIKHIKYYDDYKNDELVPLFLYDTDVTIERLS